MRGSRLRRVGLVYLALTVATAAATLGLSWAYDLGVKTLVALLPTVAGSYLAWVTFRAARLEAPKQDLPGIAEDLAAAVAERWRTEAARRGLEDRLSVRWQAAPADLVQSWTELRELAYTGAGWPPPKPAEQARWVDEPAQLAGYSHELIDVLDRVPTGRLVILGEPGAGKTALAVRLVRDLLARRRPGAAVPLLAPLAFWDPDNDKQDLHGWLKHRLVIDHPELALPAPDGSERSRAQALLDAHPPLILPVLDGLDEIPKVVRGPAIARLNDALRPGQRLVLTSRTGPYRDAVHPPNGGEVLLTGAAGIQLCPLDAAASAAYLGGSPGSPTRHRWQPVLDALTTDPPPPVAQALTTPLMVSLAKTIYNPRPDEHTGALPTPAELLGFPDRTAVKQHLFDGFIRAAYRPPSRWPAYKAERWLVFLARYLDGLSTPILYWNNISSAIPEWALRTMVGLAAGLPAGLAAGLVVGLMAGLAAGLAAGLTAGVAAGLTAGVAGLRFWERGRPGRLMVGLAVGLTGLAGLATGLATGLTVGLMAGLMAGLAAGVTVGLMARLTYVNAERLTLNSGSGPLFEDDVVGLGLTAGVAAGVAAGLTAGLTAGLPAGLAAWLPAWPPAVYASTCVFRLVVDTVNEVTLTLELTLGLMVGLAAGLTAGVAAGLTAGVAAGLTAGVAAGLTAGLVVGLIVGLKWVAWPCLAIVWGWWSAIRRRLPWALMAFLADAHQRGVLRQVLWGFSSVSRQQGHAEVHHVQWGYEFRHVELQRRLATRP